MDLRARVAPSGGVAAPVVVDGLLLTGAERERAEARTNVEAAFAEYDATPEPKRREATVRLVAALIAWEKPDWLAGARQHCRQLYYG